jgi:hypothetical protein
VDKQRTAEEIAVLATAKTGKEGFAMIIIIFAQQSSIQREAPKTGRR